MALEHRRQTLDDWFPTLVRFAGFFGLIGQLVFWGLTDKVEPAMLTACGAMVAFARMTEALTDIKRGKDK